MMVLMPRLTGGIADVEQSEVDQLMAVASGSNEEHGDGEKGEKPASNKGQKDLTFFFGLKP